MSTFLFAPFHRRLELAAQLKQWHLKVIEIVKRGQHRKSLDKLFQGFKPAVESCYFNWEVAYPLPGITYCSADKKSASFCWARAVQQQRGAKAGLAGDPPEPGGGRSGSSEGGGGDYKGRSPQQEVAVRPKETIVSKRKGLSAGGGGGVLVRLGGSVSLSLEEGSSKGMYKGAGSSSSIGGKTKLAQGGRSSGGGSGGVGGKHQAAKRRTSSEDSSLEPDMAELSLDDGSSLALGAEASNTFDFTPPPPEMLPSPSPLLREPHKYSGGGKGAGNMPKERSFEGKRVTLAATLAATESQAAFPLKENATVVMEAAVALEKEVEVEAEMEVNGNKEATPAGDARLSTSVAVVTVTAAAAKPPRGGRRETGAGAVALPNQSPAAGAGGDPVGEDDYRAYYLNAASEEGAERVPENNHEEEPDIFAGIKPLEQEGQMEVLFACAEALHAHGYSNEACRLAVELAGDLLANPPDLKVEQPQTKGKKSKVSTSRQTQVATNTLVKTSFLLTVLSERLELHNLAFSTGMFSLELQRPPASTKALEVKLAYQESEVVALLKKIPLGLVEMTSIRDRAEQLRDGNFCDYRPVLPLMLASFIFDVLCTPGESRYTFLIPH